MKYFSSTAPEVQNFSKILVEEHGLEKKGFDQTRYVFLAHSSEDKKTLPFAIGFIEKFGIKVYIDKEDKELPQKTSSETGAKLKDRIAQCSKFVILVTANSKNSRWIPWELGIADEKKKIRNVALMPDVENQSNGEWSEQEYLGLYPRIVQGRHASYVNPIWMVYDHHTNTGTELGEWLNQGN